MPDFTAVEISLARQLALPREFREGDWALHFKIGPFLVLATTIDPNAVWLPSVEDCFELLREAGWFLTVESNRGIYSAEANNGEGLRERLRGRWRDASAPTLREALYRLLLEVRENA